MSDALNPEGYSAEELARRVRLISQVWAVVIGMAMLLVLLIFLVGSLTFAQDGLDGHMADIRNETLTNREATMASRDALYANRAVECHGSILAGATQLPKVCFMPEVLVFYRPPDGIGQIPDAH